MEAAGHLAVVLLQQGEAVSVDPPWCQFLVLQACPKMA